MNQSVITLGNNEVLKTLMKTLTFVDAYSNAEGSTVALLERCSGDIIKNYVAVPSYVQL